MNEACIGRVVTSRAGRDKGRAFLIVGVCDEAHVYLSDGEKRKLSAPKKKKLKHLHVEPVKADVIAQKLNEGAKVFDAEIRKSIRSLGYNTATEDEEV